MLKHHRDIAKSFFIIYMLLCCCACSTKQHTVSTDFRALVRAGNRLGFDIKEHDNHALMLEAASWIGTPYKYGGNSRSGIDCSGLTCAIYQSVYNIRLPRRSLQQWETSILPHSHSLQQGDLLCFSSKNSQGKCAHVGIYLGEQRFIHASSTRGVVVDHLNENYWTKHFLGAKRRP